MAVPKFFRDILEYKESGKPWPGPESPVCKKCDLFNRGATTPYLPPSGSETPTVLFVFDAPSRKEDAAGCFGVDGQGAFMLRAAQAVAKDYGLTPDQFRTTAVTRCAIVTGKGNPATGGKWCRYHLYEDIKAHRPKFIVPVGSVALGLLNYKSNAQDWGGKLLTWRGWPDAWLTDKKFEDGHPVYGSRPGDDEHIPLFPLQKPQLIYGTRNPRVVAKWTAQLKRAMELAASGVTAPVYDRPWWRLTDNPDDVIAACQELIDRPGTVLTYDTETTGLHPFLGDKIVFMMFRWTDAAGQPKALGWPWDYRASDRPAELDSTWEYAQSPMLPHIPRVTPYVLEALARSKLRGHNLTFDLLFSIGTLDGGRAYLDKLCEAFYEDTWHMRYALRQERGSIGLDALAYDWAPSLAGYEEQFTLLIERYPEILSPDEGGHYANCPRKYWQTSFRPYVMGDVEVCAESALKLNEALDRTTTYGIPLAHVTQRGRFRRYYPPNRAFVYRRVLAPAGAMLAKLMARGMYVDINELERQEQLYPKLIREARDTLRASDPNLVRWCDLNEANDPAWEFDLGEAATLKKALFDVMQLPVVSLTDAGAKIYAGTPIEDIPIADRIKYASTDKFSLQHMAVKYPKVRALLDYRSKHKQYTSYVRPLRNITTPGIDKRPRVGSRLLMSDGCVHTSFKLPGTRGGRLTSCVDGDTLLDVYRAGSWESVKIRDLDITGSSSVFIMTHEHRLRRIVRKYLKPPAPMFKVRTAGGREIICTAGHRFLTRSGWQLLHNLSEGDAIKVSTRPGWLSISGKRLRRFVKQVAWHEDTATSRNEQAAIFADYSLLLEAGVHEAAPVDSVGQSFSAANGQYERNAASSRAITPCRIRSAGAAGKNSSSDCAPLRRGIVHRGTKFRDVFVAGVYKEFWVAQVFDEGGINTARSFSSWDTDGVRELHRLSREISEHDLHRLLEDAMPGMVDSGFFQDGCDGNAQAPGAGSSQRNIMARQSSRSIPCYGAKAVTDQARQRIQLVWWEAGGLCDYRHKYLDRGGRWRALLSVGSKAGCNKGEKGSRTRVQNDTVSFRDGARKDAGSASADSSGDEDTIISIEPCGIRPVWDIEVAEDSSYCAAGFINHNSSPNLQQLPRDGIIKKQFVSRFGPRGCIYQSDLSQVELRLLAAACGDPKMVQAYLDGVDLHSLTTSLVFDIPYEYFSEEHELALQRQGKADEVKKLKGKRKIGKTLNFLTGYGGGALGFQSALALQGIYISLDEAQQHLDNFFATYPYLQTHIGHYKEFIRKNGRAVSITGRVRILDEVFSDDIKQVSKAMRAGYNHLIQSTASDMMLVSMVAIEHAMREEGLESIMVSTVHDSLVIDAIRDEVPAIHAIVNPILANIPEVMRLVMGPEFDISWAIVPFCGESVIGKNYYQETKIPSGDNPDWDRVFTTAFAE